MAIKMNIPKSEYDILARCFLPSLQEFFESDEGRKEYNEWLEKQETADTDI